MRTAGFAVVSLPELHPAVQVSYMIMMYISIFPIAMSIRQSNVYEERSLGVWASREYEEDTQSSYLSHHLPRQLSFDLWFVFLGFFLVAIIEGWRLENTNEYAVSLFSVLFEIVSAYCTVGLSQGFSASNTFSGQFRTLSKLVIIVMQIRGRHRGLPYGLYRAILLPSESLHQKENEDATLRARCASNATGAGVDGLARTGTSLSQMSMGTWNRTRKSSIFKPKQIKPNLAGAFRAGPTVPLWDKRI
jgi:Trk-type K+ transport system membrane component